MPAPDPEPELDMLEAFAEAVSTSSDTVVKDAEAVSACIDVVTDAEDVPPPGPLPHTEQQDNDAPMSWLASEQQIIDLTSIIEGSPMQLAVDLPPLTRVSDKSV